jgi:hypothetical protein
MSSFRRLSKGAAAILLLLGTPRIAAAADPTFAQWHTSDSHKERVLDWAKPHLAERQRACPAVVMHPSHAAIDAAHPVVMGDEGAPIAGRWTEFVRFSGCGADQTMSVAAIEARPGNWLRVVQRVPADIPVQGDDQRNIVRRD